MESEYYRTFIGLPVQLESEALEARGALMTALEEERISWVNPDNFHITLRFLGETKLKDVRQIACALQEDMQIPTRRTMLIGQLGSFGPRKKPRVLWVGFENDDIFSLLKNQVDQVLKGCGIPCEKKPFNAHLTLGRVRSLKNLMQFYDRVDERKQAFRSSLLIDRLVFYRSIPGPQGPEYYVLEELLFF